MTDSEEWFGNGRGTLRLMLVLTAMVTTALGISEMRANTISFDGALNAQVAANLVETGRYGIGYPEIQDFDHRVQTGPTVVLPVALSFWLFDVSSTSAQLPNLLYFVAFLALVVLYAFRHAGPAGALLGVLLVLQTPGLVPISLSLYGEIPALVFFLAALVTVDRLEGAQKLSTSATIGFFLGLSVLTKIVMLMPAFSVLLVLLVTGLLRRTIRIREWMVVLGGVAVPLAAFEAVKLAVLTPAVWTEWWGVMIRRIAGQGLPSRMVDTAGALPKLDTHLGVLSHEMGVSHWLVVLLIVLPTLLLFQLSRHERIVKRPETVPVSIIALWLAATSYLAWWLVLTPTSRAWLRRVIDGLLLHEILASVVFVWAVREVFAFLGNRYRSTGVHRARRLFLGASASLLLVSFGVVLWTNLPQLELRMEPTSDRRSLDAMVAKMRSLPDEAVFYGKGWYRAPVFALLSGRELRDFHDFPISSYGKTLDHTYFVVDNHILHYRRHEVEQVLKRAVYEPVFEARTCGLYRFERVLPYAPIPIPDDVTNLTTKRKPKEGSYPFVGGLGSMAPNGRYSDTVSGFLLDRGDLGCLLVDIWASSKVGEEPHLEVRVDHRPVGLFEPVAGRQFQRVIDPGEDTSPEDIGTLVELWMHVDRPQRQFSLWNSDKNSFVVREIGFVPCSGQEEKQIGES